MPYNYAFCAGSSQVLSDKKIILMFLGKAKLVKRICESIICFLGVSPPPPPPKKKISESRIIIIIIFF